jgi:hypothetical protein
MTCMKKDPDPMLSIPHVVFSKKIFPIDQHDLQATTEGCHLSGLRILQKGGGTGRLLT